MKIKGSSRITKPEFLEPEKKWFSEGRLKQKYFLQGEEANNFKNKPGWRETIKLQEVCRLNYSHLFILSLCLSLCLSVSICPHSSLSLSFLPVSPSHTYTTTYTHNSLSLPYRFLLPYKFEITKKVYEFCNNRKRLSPISW